MSGWNFYLNSRDAWKAMLADLAAAKKSIDMEQYLWVDDEIGSRFLSVLTERARAGVRIRLLLDAAGSFGIFMNDPPEDLVQAGDVEVRFFNPISPRHFGRALSWYFRDHRRILVIDGKVGHTGGTCIQDEMADWRDTHLRIAEPVVAEMTEAFGRMWQAARERGLRNFPLPKEKDDDFRFLINSPRYQQRFVYHALKRNIRSAKSSVWLTSPYFVPSRRLFRAMRRAARRGVDVRLLLSGPSDHRLLDIAGAAYYERAFRAGIRIFLYQDRRLHAKTAVVDGRWATVGTANLDNMSLLFNYEGNIVTENREMVAELARQFREDLGSARELKRPEWRARPFSEKVLEKLVWPLHRVL